MPGKAPFPISSGQRARGSQSVASSAPTPPDRWLRLVDLGLGAVIFVAPLFMGGRYEIGRLVFVAAVCFTALAWVVRQCVVGAGKWRWSGAELLLLAGLLVILLQLLPLPPALLHTLAPETSQLLPLWSADSETPLKLGTWNQVSLSPQATRGGLVTYLAYVMLFLVVVQRIQHRSDLERLLRWLALAAVGMAALGLAQMLLSNGKFLWIYEHPFRDTHGAVKGTFQNQNHFAHFLALGIGPLIWWLWSLNQGRAPRSFQAGAARLTGHDALRHGLSIGLGLLVVAGLLTFSRGGAVAIFTATAVCGGIYFGKRLVGKRAVAAMGLLALVVLGSLAIYGYEPLSRRLSTLRDAHSLAELCRGRNALWAAHRQAIPRAPLLGTGVGSHRDIYPVYLSEDFDVEFSHGESGYQHLLVETGFLGAAVLLTGAGLALAWGLRALWAPGDSRQVAYAGALLAGIGTSLVHAAGDFVWYIPACMSLTVVIAAGLCRLNHWTLAARTAEGGETRRRFAGREWSLSRLGWGAGAAVTLAVVAAMLADRTPAALAAVPWEQYFKAARQSRLAGQSPHATPESVAVLSRHLEQVLRQDPYHVRANLRLAGLRLGQFDQEQLASENPLALAQIREAALASQFPSQAAQEKWLQAVTGPRRALLDDALKYTRRALALGPLQGEGYVYLAELSFLEGNSPQAKAAYVAQALRVRPYSGQVLMAAGLEAALAGDMPRAMDLWKQAFHAAAEQRNQLIQMLALQLPPDQFVQQFAPDAAGLGQLYSFYLARNLPDQARAVAGRYVAALETELPAQTGRAAADSWAQASAVYSFLGDTARAAACARRAVQHAPDDFDKHKTLALALLANRQYDEARRELTWCVSRAPDDANLQQLLATAAREQRSRL